MPSDNCRCMTPPFWYRHFDKKVLGMDQATRWNGEASIERCKKCGREWLRYLYENEAFTKSGRWYCGLITPEQAQEVTANTALALLASLSWHFYGGSYYDSTGQRRDEPLDLRHL
jgi:hypothetical protein